MASKPKPKKKASKGAARKMTAAQQSALFVETAKNIEVRDGKSIFEKAIGIILNPTTKSPTSSGSLKRGLKRSI